MMIRDVRYSRNFFSIYYGISTYLPYLKVPQCNDFFFFQLISCFGKGDTIHKVGIVIVIVRGATCWSRGAHSKDKYLTYLNKE